MKTPQLNKLQVGELLTLHAEIMTELNKREILRSQNNPTGDYAEYLAAKVLQLKLESNSKSGFDATDAGGKKVQIKGRRVTAKNPSRQLGIIRDLEGRRFDYLIGIIFGEFYTVDQALKIPHELVRDYATFSELQNGHILHLSGEILSDNRIENITNILVGAKI